MKFLKNLLVFILLAGTLVLGALFAVQNTAQVPLDLLVIYLPERSIALWVLLAFAIGGVVGMLTNIGLVWRLRAALLKANRRLSRLEQTEAIPARNDTAQVVTESSPTNDTSITDSTTTDPTKEN